MKTWHFLSIVAQYGIIHFDHHCSTPTHTGTNADWLSIGSLQTNCCKMLIKMWPFSPNKMHLNMSAKYLPFWSLFNVRDIVGHNNTLWCMMVNHAATKVFCCIWINMLIIWNDWVDIWSFFQHFQLITQDFCPCQWLLAHLQHIWPATLSTDGLFIVRLDKLLNEQLSLLRD